MHEKSQAINIKVLGHDHVDVAKSYNNMALIYEAQGKHVELLELHEKSKAITIKAFGHDHVDVIRTCNNIANVYELQGLHEKARIARRDLPA